MMESEKMLLWCTMEALVQPVQHRRQYTIVGEQSMDAGQETHFCLMQVQDHGSKLYSNKFIGLLKQGLFIVLTLTLQ